MKQVISTEAAQKEWEDFLTENDAETLIPRDKEDKEEYRRLLAGYDRAVKAISTGKVIIDNGIVTQILAYPIKGKDTGETVLDKLVFNQRWTAKDREEIFKGMTENEASQAMMAQRKLCSKLTGVDMAILQRLDFSDLKITDSIVAVFFI